MTTRAEATRGVGVAGAGGRGGLHVNLAMASKGMTYVWGPSEFSGTCDPCTPSCCKSTHDDLLGGHGRVRPFWGTEHGCERACRRGVALNG